MKNGFVAAVGALVAGFQGAILYTQNKIMAQQTELISQQVSLLKSAEERQEREFLKQGLDAAEKVLTLMISADKSGKYYYDVDKQAAKSQLSGLLSLTRYSLYDRGSPYSPGLHELLEKTSPDVTYHLKQIQRSLALEDERYAQEKHPGDNKLSPSKP